MTEFLDVQTIDDYLRIRGTHLFGHQLGAAVEPSLDQAPVRLPDQAQSEIAKDTGVAVSAILATQDSGELFLSDGQTKWPIDWLTFYALGGRPSWLTQLPSEGIRELRTETPIRRMFDNGTLIKGPDDPIYLISHGVKRWIPDMETLASVSRSGSYLIVNEAALDAIADGPPMPSVTAKRRLRSPLFGRFASLSPAAAIAADVITITGFLLALGTKLAHLW